MHIRICVVCMYLYVSVCICMYVCMHGCMYVGPFKYHVGVRCIATYCNVLHCVLCVALCCVVLHCIELNCVVLHCSLCSVLYWILPRFTPMAWDGTE